MVTSPTKPVPMPKSLVHYWTMWNEPEVELIRGHLDQAVTEGVVWADPVHHHVGRDALHANVTGLRTKKPDYRFVIASEIDGHNDHLRYEWYMMRKHRVLLRGLDIVTLDANGLIDRVDGFFGPTILIRSTDSGIPRQLTLEVIG